jgi:2-polyprenyl-3-methyl-5-hydroxy-6-metoxy-1,4-benzoquinol methylase
VREDEIRPDALMVDQKALYLQDVEDLLKDAARFVAVPCPACGSREARREFEKYRLSYLRCAACRTVYVSPRPTPPLLERYYQTSRNYEYWSKHVFPASEDARRRKIFVPRASRTVELLQAHGVAGGTLLEVGAGFGLYCEEMRKLGFFERIIAVEPTPPLAESCRRRGLEVVDKRVEELAGLAASVDVVANFEVIEHLFEPKAFLADMRRLLRPGGLLVLTCPNAEGFDVTTLRELSDVVDTEHLNYFTPQSLSARLGREGFEVLETATPGELDAELVRKKVLAGEFDLAGQPFLRKVLIDEWDRHGRGFQDYLVRAGLSSHLWVVARRPR